MKEQVDYGRESMWEQLNRELREERARTLWFINNAGIDEKQIFWRARLRNFLKDLKHALGNLRLRHIRETTQPGNTFRTYEGRTR
jgi:hypothetical protein